jgi:hypothetical protein
LDIPKFITENALAIAALATVAYALLTYLLWADSSTFRATANVAVYPSPFDRTARYFSVLAENYGPAPALNFSVTYWLIGGHGEQLFNDRACCYSDNSGSIQVVVSVSP